MTAMNEPAEKRRAGLQVVGSRTPSGGGLPPAGLARARKKARAG